MGAEGDAVTGMAGPDAADGAVAATRAPTNRCRNCGADAPRNYCPNCGQETTLALPSAASFLRDTAGRYIRFDGRMWRSLQALLFRPGFLTREYLAGRRRRYVRPARLFVALSIVLFAVLRFSAATPIIKDTEDARPDRQALVDQASAETRDMGIHVDRNFNLDFDARSWPQLAPLRRRVDAFNRLPRQEKAEQLMAGVFRFAPYAAIGLLPLFALLLGIVYAGGRQRHPSRPTRYAAHLVFGAHNHAFLFLVATVIALVEFWPLRATLLVWTLIYGLASLKVVYGGSWPGVALRAIVITVAYSMFFAIAVAALLVAAVTLR